MTHMQMVNGSLFMKERQEALLIELEPIAVIFFKKGIQSIYDHVKKNNKIRRFILKEFQYALKNISNWSTEVKELEWVRFKNISSKNVEKTIQGIFKVHSIILKGFKDDNVTPTGLDYMYECYLNIARYLWKDPFLLYDIGVNDNEVHRKMKEFEKVIAKLVRTTFVEMIKVDPIDIDDEDVVADDEESSDSELDFSDKPVEDDNLKEQGVEALSDAAEVEALEDDIQTESDGSLADGSLTDGSDDDELGEDIDEKSESDGSSADGSLSDGSEKESLKGGNEPEVDESKAGSISPDITQECVTANTKVVYLSPKKDDDSSEESDKPDPPKNVRVVKIESMNLLEKKRRVKQLLIKSNKDSFF